MEPQYTTAQDADLEVRWRAWQARGAEADRRTAMTTRTLSVLIAIALGGWLLVQLV